MPVAMTDTRELQQNGWFAVPLDPSKIFGTKPYNHVPGPLLLERLEFPDQDPVVQEVNKYARENLPAETLNHSMRVYHYGTFISSYLSLPLDDHWLRRAVAMAILREQFPEHADQLSPSTLALACLLHDLGTTASNMSATRMSFEFYGALQARDLLLSNNVNATQDTAHAVFEAIIRHQDLGTEGNITFLGQLIQLATIYDNVGGQHPTVPGFEKIIHEHTREEVIEKFPRTGWLGCFAKTVRQEIEMKPWCHTTHIPGFAKIIEANELMQPYE